MALLEAGRFESIIKWRRTLIHCELDVLFIQCSDNQKTLQVLNLSVCNDDDDVLHVGRTVAIILWSTLLTGESNQLNCVVFFLLDVPCKKVLEVHLSASKPQMGICTVSKESMWRNASFLYMHIVCTPKKTWHD